MVSMAARNELFPKYKKRYKQCKSKAEKTQLVDEVCECFSWSRKHCIARLNDSPSYNRHKCGRPKRRGPKPKFTKTHIRALQKLWALLDYVCSKRLKAAIPDLLKVCCQQDPWFAQLEADVITDLCSMSASTIDRLLEPDRKRMNLKGRATTKPGSLLKTQIPIRMGREWDDAVLGFEEIDTVAHSGPTAKGEHCWTLDMTDVASGWSEQYALRNKAEVHTVTAIKEIQKRLPFKLLGLDSDNGSEFINGHLIRFCKKEGLTFTRSRPYNKNDGCHIEEKNWSIIRRVVGYWRYEGQDSCDLLNELYVRQRLMTNYFMPSAKQIVKLRDGSRVIRKHDEPKTPYRRVLEMEDVPEATKERLRKEYETLNPIALRKEIAAMVKKLQEMSTGL